MFLVIDAYFILFSHTLLQWDRLAVVLGAAMPPLEVDNSLYLW